MDDCMKKLRRFRRARAFRLESLLPGLVVKRVGPSVEVVGLGVVEAPGEAVIRAREAAGAS